MGRPRAFATVEELQQGIDEYFADCEANDKAATVSGLACALDVDRQTLLNYREDNHEFFGTVKKAIQRIEADKADKALRGKYNTTFAIFDLKNNHGWRDEKHIQEKSEQDVKHSATPETIDDLAERVANRLKPAFGD